MRLPHRYLGIPIPHRQILGNGSVQQNGTETEKRQFLLTAFHDKTLLKNSFVIHTITFVTAIVCKISIEVY